MKRIVLSVLLILVAPSISIAGPKGDIFVPFTNTPKQIDGDFRDWGLASYTTISQQPEFPDGQGVGEPTDASGDHIVWDIDRIGPFNGTDPLAYEPDGPSDYGSAVYFAWDNTFLYALGVFIDDSPFGARGPDGFSNFLNDGFEFFIDANNDSGLPAEFSFPSFDDEDGARDDFQFTMGLNNEFEPNPKAENDLGVEVHMERAGNFEIVKDGYLLDVREETDFGPVGGRDVAAKFYEDLREAGALNPEIVENPGTEYSGYAVELVVPFGITEGFDPSENAKMGFDLFWRDVDEDPDLPGEPITKDGFGGSAILWADWNHATEVTAVGEDGNLFNGGNWGELIFVSGDPCDFDGDGVLGAGDLELLVAASASGDNVAAFDLNGDGAVNSTDVNAFVTGEDKLHSYIGDANLDGEFNSSDFVAVFQAGLFESNNPATWAQGDWNGDGVFNSSDFVVAFQDGGFELGPRWPAQGVAQVPEPRNLILILMGISALTWPRRKR